MTMSTLKFISSIKGWVSAILLPLAVFLIGRTYNERELAVSQSTLIATYIPYLTKAETRTLAIPGLALGLRDKPETMDQLNGLLTSLPEGPEKADFRRLVALVQGKRVSPGISTSSTFNGYCTGGECDAGFYSDQSGVAIYNIALNQKEVQSATLNIVGCKDDDLPVKLRGRLRGVDLFEEALTIPRGQSQKPWLNAGVPPANSGFEFKNCAPQSFKITNSKALASFQEGDNQIQFQLVGHPGRTWVVFLSSTLEVSVD